MKKFLYLAVIGITALFAFNSCNNGGGETTDTLSVSTPEVIAMGGGTKTFNITSNTSWTITKAEADSWLTVDPMSGSGNATINVTAVANTGEERSAALTVTAGSLTPKKVTIIQEGDEGAFINLGSAPVISSKGGTTKFMVAANVDWTITKTDEWITSITPTTGSGAQEVTVTATANTGAKRTATITVTGGEDNNITRTITLNQNAPGDETIETTWNFNGWSFFKKTNLAWEGTIAGAGNDMYVLDNFPFDEKLVDFHELLIKGNVEEYDYVVFTDTDKEYGLASVTFDDGTEATLYQTIGGYTGRDAAGVYMLTGYIELELSDNGEAIIIPEQIEINSDSGPIILYPTLGTYVTLVENGQDKKYWINCVGEIEIIKKGASAAPKNVITKKGMVQKAPNLEIVGYSTFLEM